MNVGAGVVTWARVASATGIYGQVGLAGATVAQAVGGRAAFRWTADTAVGPAWMEVAAWGSAVSS